MDSLEINVEPAKGPDDLSLEGIATQIDCDDVDLSPARENVKFFSQDSITNRSISTEKSAHEADRSKHFQKLGSAAFVGMEGLSSPNPNGGGGRGGRGIPVRRRTFHSSGTPGASNNTQDDSDLGSVQNAAAAASTFLNMPPPRTRQNNAPVTPSMPPASQSTLPESDQKSGTETQSQRRPSSMFVRRSVVESLFGNEESENAAVSGMTNGNNNNNDNNGDAEGGDRLDTGESNETDDALAAATAAATLYNTSLNANPNTSTESPTVTAATSAVDMPPVVYNTRSSSDDSVYNHIVRSIPSVEAAATVTVTASEETAASTTEEREDDTKTSPPVAAASVTEEGHLQSSVAEEENNCSDSIPSDSHTDVPPTELPATATNSSTTCATNSANNNPTLTSTTSTPATHTTTYDHAPIHTIQPPGPNKNPAKFVAPTYTQHPVSFLKVGKGTVNISTSVSAAANINAGKSKSGQNSAVNSVVTSSSSSSAANNNNSEISGATNAEKAKAMVGVGSVKDRIKKFETLKTDSTDNSNHPADGKKAPHRRASLS